MYVQYKPKAPTKIGYTIGTDRRRVFQENRADSGLYSLKGGTFLAARLRETYKMKSSIFNGKI
jgi:hypothetical protein